MPDLAAEKTASPSGRRRIDTCAETPHPRDARDLRHPRAVVSSDPGSCPVVLYVSMILREQLRRINHRPITPAQLVNFKQIRVALLLPFFSGSWGKWPSGRQENQSYQRICRQHYVGFPPVFGFADQARQESLAEQGSPIGQIIVVQCIFSGTPKDICAVPVEFPEFDSF